MRQRGLLLRAMGSHACLALSQACPKRMHMLRASDHACSNNQQCRKGGDDGISCNACGGSGYMQAACCCGVPAGCCPRAEPAACLTTSAAHLHTATTTSHTPTADTIATFCCCIADDARPRRIPRLRCCLSRQQAPPTPSCCYTAAAAEL
jgi:hypothetical protein